jgi:hypothetical protein
LFIFHLHYVRDLVHFIQYIIKGREQKFLDPNQLRDLFLVKSYQVLFPFLYDRHPLLAGELEHPDHGGLVLGKVVLLKGDLFLAKELLRGQAFRSGGQGIDLDVFHKASD